MESTKILLPSTNNLTIPNNNHNTLSGAKRKSMSSSSSTSNSNNSYSFSTPLTAPNGGSYMNHQYGNQYSNGNGNGNHHYNGTNLIPMYTPPATLNTNSLITTGACAKCGGKKRHSKSCIYKRNDDDESNILSKDIIQKLDVAALKRYKKHYRLKTKHNSTKAELASAVRVHFDGLPVNEYEIIEHFMVKVKTIPTQ
eukprot:gene9721-11937_t